MTIIVCDHCREPLGERYISNIDYGVAREESMFIDTGVGTMKINLQNSPIQLKANVCGACFEEALLQALQGSQRILKPLPRDATCSKQ